MGSKRNRRQDPGIYKITNTINGKTYIGQTVRDLMERMGQHRCHLEKGDHHNRHLQSSWNKHGESTFEFSIVERVGDLKILTEREQHHLDLVPAPKRYNIGECCDSPNTKRKFTPEHCAKISKALKGKCKHWKGKKHSEETKAKMSEAHKKPVVQLDYHTGVIINDYPSAYEAREHIGKGDIRSCCQGRTKSAGGYRWRYKD